MSKKLYFLISVVLVLVFASSAHAQEGDVYWTGAGSDNDWCTGDNWDTGQAPYVANWQGWPYVQPRIDIASMSDPVLISAAAACAPEGGMVVVGDTVDTVGVGDVTTLSMTGGEAKFMEIAIGYGEDGVGKMEMSGGHISLDHYGYLGVGDGGDGTLIMTGGTIDCNGTTWSGGATTWGSAIIVPKNEQGEGTGHLQLDGGTLKARRLSINERGTVDITSGKIILMKYDGVWAGLNTQADVIAGVVADVNDGNLTAYGGAGIVGIAVRAPDDVNDPNEIWIAARFSAGTAWLPTPEHGAVDILQDVVLSWSPGDYVQAAGGHKLYFSETFSDVNSRSVSAVALSSPTYDLGANVALELGKVYYWAVDEVNSATTWAGPVWRFTMDRGVAKYPDPANGADEIPKTGATLSWTPGIAAASTNGHDVYFGTSWAEVNDANTNWTQQFQGNQSEANWATSNYASSLELVTTYYWRVDEINSSDLWKGDVWSFEVEGRAKNPDPVNGAVDIPYLGLELSWDAGVDAVSHDVYFGSDIDAVSDANTNSDEFKINQGGTSHVVSGQLLVGATYYWRIDEHPASRTLKGHIWSFTVGQFLILDNFDQYPRLDTEMYDVWDDGVWVNPSDSELGLEAGDMNYIRGGEGKSMLVIINNENASGGKYIGSWVDAQDMTELEAGGDWTVGGVKAMTLYLIGDPCNLPHVGEVKGSPLIEKIAPWVEVEDTSANIGWVAYDSPTDMLYDYQWFEWNIDLAVFDACGVTLSAIDRLTIGFGGDRVGQKAKPTKNTYGYVHIDDLRLYPARCITEFAQVAGNITDGDCTINNFDMQIMGEDWLIADGCFPTEQQDANITMAEGAGDPNWTTGQINGALGLDPNIEVDVCDPGLMGSTNLSITCWVKRNGVQEGYVGIVTSREKGLEDATELAGGKDGDIVGYCWNQITATWQFGDGPLVPDGQWTLMAMAVDPTGCSLYAGPAGGTLNSARHAIELTPLEQFDVQAFIGRGREDGRFYIGAIDDVRIYDRTLDASEMAWLHTGGVDGNDPCCPAYHYELDESSGLTAVDSGCGAIVYRPVMSPANLTNPEPVNYRFVNFRDFDIMASNWLEEYLWPPQ